MASKSNKSKAKSKPAKAKKSAAAKKPAQAATGDHVRMLAPKAAVVTFVKEIVAAKNQTSTAGQLVSTATKNATDRGVNVPAARIAARLYSKALQDPGKARVLWEDVAYYLEECMDFDKIAPLGMFPADEVRSTKNGSGKTRKKKGQLDLADREDVKDNTTEATDDAGLPAGEPTSDEAEQSQVVH